MGLGDPGEPVSVTYRGQTASGIADVRGHWQVHLKPLSKSMPANMTITAARTVVIHDVIVGDVWLASGQSNMEYGMARLHNIPAEQNSKVEIPRANYPDIRIFLVQEKAAKQPEADVRGRWQRCSPSSVGPFSAVSYFFARELHLTQHVPIGVIGSYWGGSPAQSWTSVPALRSDPAFQFIFDAWGKALQRYPVAGKKYEHDLSAWQAAPDDRPPSPPDAPGTFRSPGALFNGMIAPITPFTICGVIWYQGESDSNPEFAYAYRHLFATLIEDWRRAWSLGSVPFYFVQLSSYIEKGWRPLLRESQAETLKLRNTAMAVTIDIGNPTYNHPANKHDVGHRLALPARALVYGEKIVYSGPVFRQMTVEGAKARIWFEPGSGDLRVRGDGGLAGFEIAAPDGRFLPGKSHIDSHTVIVSNPSISRPAMVRYAWSDNPSDANLINAQQLPASPFRTLPSPEK